MSSEEDILRNGIATFLAMSCAILYLLVAQVVSTGFAAQQDSQVLSLEAHISLPNVEGRIDHFGVDVKGQRLFVAAVDNHTLEVIDLKSGKRVHTITGLAEPQGVFYDPSTNRLFVACGLDGVTKVFDGTTFHVLATAKYPDDADNIRYDALTKSVIVGYAGAKHLRKREEGTGGLGFIDANGKKTGDIVVDAHPESFQLEKSGPRLFVNIPEKKEIEVIDRLKRAVLARWSVSEENNFPMAFDEAHHRLFVACWKPPRLVIFNTETGKAVATGEVAGSSDDLFYDSQRARIYVLTSQGFLEVFQQKDPDHYDRVARYPTPPHTQTGLFVPEWGKLFAAVPKQGEQSAEVRVYQAH
jgi:DNA-binding beta-propeller fold protein YncE